MNERHRLEIETDDGHHVVFVCPEPGCGRRVVVHRSGDMVVLSQGDFYALHSGGPQGLAVALTMAPGEGRPA